MKRELIKNILLIALVIITILAVYRTISEMRRRYELMIELNRTKDQVVFLEEEKQKLLKQIEKGKINEEKLTKNNQALKGYLRASKRRMDKALSDYSKISPSYGNLVAENKALRQENIEISKENETLKSKLNITLELKKAVKELKKQALSVGKKMIKKGDESSMGNRGYITKDGRSTSSHKVKIDVTPDPSQQAPKKE